jgi:hypothetical protein
MHCFYKFIFVIMKGLPELPHVDRQGNGFMFLFTSKFINFLKFLQRQCFWLDHLVLNLWQSILLVYFPRLLIISEYLFILCFWVLNWEFLCLRVWIFFFSLIVIHFAILSVAWGLNGQIVCNTWCLGLINKQMHPINYTAYDDPRAVLCAVHVTVTQSAVCQSSF